MSFSLSSWNTDDDGGDGDGDIDDQVSDETDDVGDYPWILDVMKIIMKNYPFSETRYGRGDLKRGFQRSRLRWSRWSGTLWWIIRKGHDLIDLSDISCIHHPHPHLDRCHNDNVKSTIAFIKSLNIVKISAGPADP